MKKILAIVGPTSTGKTTLALKLAKIINSEIISADSRQIYKNMDIGTGKDIPKGSKWIKPRFKTGYWLTPDNTKIWGYDLVDPKKEFSVGQYEKTMNQVLKNIEKSKKVAIVVGGTGLYVKSLIDGIETSSVPKNKKIRKTYEGKSVEELLKILTYLDPFKAGSLNNSDIKNKRRLIRAIEIALAKPAKKKENKKPNRDILMIGLKTKPEVLEDKIKNRVLQRMNDEFTKELNNLLTKKVSFNKQSMSSFGYKIWNEYQLGKITKEQAHDMWVREEKNYARKQNVWFKKDNRIKWFDTLDKNFEAEIVEIVKSWYDKK